MEKNSTAAQCTAVCNLIHSTLKSYHAQFQDAPVSGVPISLHCDRLDNIGCRSAYTKFQVASPLSSRSSWLRFSLMHSKQHCITGSMKTPHSSACKEQRSQFFLEQPKKKVAGSGPDGLASTCTSLGAKYMRS
ncbi:hypothetical protein NPIL_118311 [Nephila pilipes]|uniref:Uncharacterized protein n=1 Tax=Nephila pilipes TaxID=299642 RepID=A0A8X6U1M1_NEPPI|nr:hypothetical protein NPIL_118311 [Nephila pilipes]